MNTKQDPRELAVALLNRSRCSVQVACVIADSYGVFAWGWNHTGSDGLGLCAERHALSRANRSRLKGATLYVVGRRKKSKSFVNAKPCDKCWAAIPFGTNIVYSNRGQWSEYV